MPGRPLDHDSGFAQGGRGALELAGERVGRLRPTIAQNIARLLTRFPKLGGGFLDFRLFGVFPCLGRLGVGSFRLPHRTANIMDKLDQQLGCGSTPLATLSHEQTKLEGGLFTLDDVLGGVTDVDVERGGESSLRPQGGLASREPAVKTRHSRQRLELERLLDPKPVRDRAAQSAQNVGVKPPEHELEALFGHPLVVGNIGQMDEEGALGEVAAPDHVFDRGDQERRARDDQGFVGVGEQLALRLAAALRDGADGVRQPVGQMAQVVVGHDQRMRRGDVDLVHISRLRPQRRGVGVDQRPHRKGAARFGAARLANENEDRVG